MSGSERSPSPQRSATSPRSRSSGFQSSHHERERAISRSPSRHSSTRSSGRSHSSERAMSNHEGSERATSRSPSRHSSQARFRSQSQSRSRSHSSERVRNEHKEHKDRSSIHSNHETYNNEHRQTHGSHNDHRTTYTTYNNFTSYTPPLTSPHRSYRKADHRAPYYPEDEAMFPDLPGLLSLPVLSRPSRTSWEPLRAEHHDNYYREDRYRDSRRSALNVSLPHQGAAGAGALGLAAGALGGFLGSNATSGEGASTGRSRYGQQPYSSNSQAPHPNSLVPQPYSAEQLQRRESRNGGRQDERPAPGSAPRSENRESRPSNGHMKPCVERSDWDHFRPEYRSRDRVPIIHSASRGQGDFTNRDDARDPTNETANSNNRKTAREYRADGTIKEAGVNPHEYRADGTVKEAGVNPFDTPPSRGHSARSKCEGGGKKENIKDPSSSKMTGAYGIPLDRLVAPSGMVAETAKSVGAGASKIARPASPSYERYGGVGGDGVLEDHIVPQTTVPAGMGRMPEGVKLEKRLSRLGTFMGKLCGSARA